jgi:hypothetical protein
LNRVPATIVDRRPAPDLIAMPITANASNRSWLSVPRPSSWLVPPLCVLSLLWPAVWNGYPIVFADTGTYLSQAMHRYLGWDRPIFYSLFIYPLHLGLTTWPVILMQSIIAVFVLNMTRHAFGIAEWWLLPLTIFLSVATWLPWMVSEVMPDLFTPLLVLLLSLLLFSAARFRAWSRAVLTLMAAFMITTQQSSVPLALALVVVFVPLYWVARRSRGSPVGMFAPPLAVGLAIAAMMTVNAAGFGKLSLSPYGNVFLLARMIYDGPGMAVLRRDCPERGWRLCPFLDRFPAAENDFLWKPASPIMLAGGHKAVSADADAIILATVASEPGGVLAAAWHNTIEQLTRFASGDGLESWNQPVGEWIDKDFPPRERASFHAARQQMGILTVPRPLALLHRDIALAGIAAALLLLPVAWYRRSHAVGWYLAVSLLTLPISAAITGGLSGPFDRYQSRIVWLPAAVVFLGVPALVRPRSITSETRRLPERAGAGDPREVIGAK